MPGRGRLLHPILPGGLLSPFSGADELSAGEEALIDNLGAGALQNETPTGTVNGINVSFTVAGTPIANSLKLFLNGQLQYAGGTDYTLSSSTITYASAPLTGSTHRVWYMSTST